MMSHRQIRGVIAIAILLAVIPLFLLATSDSTDSRGPMLSESGNNRVSVEIISQKGLSGIYFIDEGSSLRDLLQRIDVKNNINENIQLQNAMSIQLPNNENLKQVVLGKMAASKRLALGIPLDINRTSHEDLMMIPGIGEVLAEKIVLRRDAVGRFTRLEQLMEIKGIKEKKLSKLSPYLCIE